MNKWLVQDTNIPLYVVNEYLRCLKQLNFDTTSIGVLKDSGEISNLPKFTNDTKYIIKGGVRVVKELINSKYGSGIFYDNDTFDQAYYNEFDLPLLNKKCEIIPVKECLHRTFQKDMFIKPSTDLKAFNGGILPAGQTIKEFVLEGNYQASYIKENIIISNLKNIKNEYRFCVVNSEVIAGSLYKRGIHVKYDSNIPNSVMRIAQEFAKLYNPHDIFVMDIAECDTGYKIIEYNCWNASGLYYCDLKKTFEAVNNYMLEK